MEETAWVDDEWADVGTGEEKLKPSTPSQNAVDLWPKEMIWVWSALD